MDKMSSETPEKSSPANAAVVVGILGYIVTTALVFTFGRNEKMLMAACHEDALFEWSQAIFLFMASVMFMILFLSRSKEKKDIFIYMGLFFAVICIFGFLEEISYGQRIFHIKSPYFFDRFNSHKEINIHNLPMFDNASELVSFLFLVIWGIILPVVLHLKKSWREFADKKWLFTPPAAFCVFNIIGLAIEFFLRYTYKAYWADSNVILESYLCWTIFATSFYYMGLRLQSGEDNREEVQTTAD
ncbi:MAG: hypothetical protein LWY06_11625 [Firmicutes bacterium]|nr:hypothetical protein [Bacillota bacterium]